MVWVSQEVMIACPPELLHCAPPPCRTDALLWSTIACPGGETLNPQYKNATVRDSQFYPLNFCSALVNLASNGT